MGVLGPVRSSQPFAVISTRGRQKCLFLYIFHDAAITQTKATLLITYSEDLQHLDKTTVNSEFSF